MKSDVINNILKEFQIQEAVELIIHSALSNHKTGFDIMKFDKHYSQPYRYYHTWKHIQDVIMYLIDNKQTDDKLIIAAAYHDLIYDPKARDNEQRSANEFLKDWKGSKKDGKIIYDMILDTRTHIGRSDLSLTLIMADLNIFTKPFEEIIQYDNKIFKEYQFADWKLYKEKRIQALESLSAKSKGIYSNGINYLVEYLKAHKPKIGVFVGSFNPFHNGHLNVLHKAEKVFDKVIIARGINADKKDRPFKSLPKILDYHQKEMYHGMIDEFLNQFDYEFTLVRGIRDEKDFYYENNMAQYVRDFTDNKVNTAYFICDREFAHVSSSDVVGFPSEKQKKYL